MNEEQALDMMHRISALNLGPIPSIEFSLQGPGVTVLGVPLVFFMVVIKTHTSNTSHSPWSQFNDVNRLHRCWPRHGKLQQFRRLSQNCFVPRE